MDGRSSLFSVHMRLCTFERIHMLPLERCVVMDERHPLPVQQWKRLKHLGPRDGPCHSPPILVTYGAAMLNTVGLLLWV